MLVKWQGLQYAECSWEPAPSIPQSSIDTYNHASNRDAAEAAKQERQRELGWLKKDSLVEAAPLEPSLHGSWHEASALSLNEQSAHVFVMYSSILANEDDVDGSMLRERLPVRRVRPQPPRTAKDWKPDVGAVVGARLAGGWWATRVVAVARRGEPLVDMRSERAKQEELHLLLQPTTAPNEASLAVGDRADGRDGRQWELVEPLSGSARRKWELSDPQPEKPQRPAGGEDRSTRASGLKAEVQDEPSDKRRSRREKTPAAAAAAAAAPPKMGPHVRGVHRDDLPGTRIVVTYTEEEETIGADEKPEGGAELGGRFIEVHWPLDRAWSRAEAHTCACMHPRIRMYASASHVHARSARMGVRAPCAVYRYRAEVLRHVPSKRQHEILYLDDNVKEVIDLGKEEWRHVATVVRTAYPGVVVRGEEVEGTPSLLSYIYTYICTYICTYIYIYTYIYTYI